MVVSNALQNLFLDIQGNTEGIKPGGTPLRRIITLQNRGSQTAYIDLWLEPTDQKSTPLQQWGIFDKSESDLVLLPNASLDVTLRFEVPLQVEPGFYSYEIRMRSSQYPGEDIRRGQQLQVLPSDHEARLRSEPKLRLTPITDSEHPHSLSVGETLTFTLTVENPSRRTDRFFLTCTDLDPTWFTVSYPENTANLPGIVTYTDGLQLNPGDTGNIQLHLHPPQYTPAGLYFPTLRLTSRIREDIVLFKVVYVNLVANDQMAVALNPRNLPIPSLNQSFQISFVNEGNIRRQLVYQAWDPDRVLHYRLQPTKITLAPGEENTVQLTVHPRHWWHRLWRLQERTINFDLLVENAPIWPQSKDSVLPPWIPSLPQSLPTGTVTLKVKRRWLFRLLTLSLGTGLLLTLAWVIWKLLFWRPSLQPRITHFSSAQETYQEAKDEDIRLDWDIVNVDRVGTLEVEVSYNNQQNLKTYTLNSQAGVIMPPELEQEKLEQEKCSVEEMAGNTSVLGTLLSLYRSRQTGSPNQKVLHCRGIVLEGLTLEKGTYAFKLTVLPIPCSEKEIAGNTSVLRTLFSLYRGRQTGSPNQKVLPCRSEVKPFDVKFLEDVVVAPPAPPQIQTIKASASEYRTVSDINLVKPFTDGVLVATDSPIIPVVNRPASMDGRDPQPLTVSTPEPTKPIVPITLDWTVSNRKDILELRLVSLAPDGAENTAPVSYSFSEGLPPELTSFCQEEGAQLSCKNVPTHATEVGDYVFYLTVVTVDGNSGEPIVKSTPTISIKPPAPEIVDFQVNGESVRTKPRHVYVINPARGSMDIVLSWQVKNAKAVELLPAPGVVQGNTLTYTLSAAPGAETITLRVVNELEEEVTQSVVIEKVEYVAGSQAPLLRVVDPSELSQPQINPVTDLPELPPPPNALPVPALAPIRTPPQAN